MLANYSLKDYQRIYGKHNVITLDSCQIQSGMCQAAMRDAASAKLGHSNVRDLEEDEGVSLQGSLGEIAAYVRFALPFAYSVNKWKEPDLIIDDLLVDVKTSQENCDALCIAPRHLHPEWFYFLVSQVNSDSFVFIGWIKGDKVSQFPLHGTKTRKAPAYFVPRSALTPFKPVLK